MGTPIRVDTAPTIAAAGVILLSLIPLCQEVGPVDFLASSGLIATQVYVSLPPATARKLRIGFQVMGPALGEAITFLVAEAVETLAAFDTTRPYDPYFGFRQDGYPRRP